MADGMAPTRPALRYHGGKWVLAPWIVSLFPPHRVYLEPFGGAASVLLRKGRAYAEVYNDMDGEVVNLFCVLRDPGQAEALEAALRLTPFARDEFDLAYEPAPCPIERARRLVVRSFMGHASSAATRESKSGFRCDSNRSGSTPAHDWMGLPDNVSALTARLQGVVIENRPALDVIARFDGPDALIYADPPYVRSTRSAFGNQYRHEMSDAEHVELIDALQACEGAVIVSGYRSALYDDGLAGWQRHDRDTRATAAAERTECLWLNGVAADALEAARAPDLLSGLTPVCSDEARA